MDCTTKTANPESCKADCIAVGIFEDLGPTDSAKRIDEASGGAVRAALRSGDMTGKRGTLIVLRSLAKVTSPRIALVGLGKSTDFGDKAYAEAIATAVRGCGAGVATLAIAASEWAVRDRGLPWAARALVLAARAARFRTDELKSRAGNGKGDDAKNPARIHWLHAKADRAIDRALREGAAIADGMELAKRLGNLPGNVCTPDYLAGEARKIARQGGMTAQILDRRGIERLGMGSFLSVTRGSEQPPRLIVLRYHGDGKPGFANPIALVGKGITFDSGGLSLKPPASMMTMKDDMGGAAAVICATVALAQLNVPVNVVCWVAATENMPSGTAIHPGDVLTARNGRTIEVLNTDAEGRLVLADALSLAVEEKPDAIIDVATLTGGQRVALGDKVAAVMGTDEALIRRVIDAGAAAGEPAWELPLYAPYRKLLDSEVADLKNVTGGPAASSIMAGLFLQEFAGDGAWAHLDIAAPAWSDSEDGWISKGGTGWGVRTLVELVSSW